MSPTYSHDFSPTFPEKYGRLSGLEAHKKGYLPAKVFVDGREVSDCVLFDDNQGWADLYVRDGDGNILVNDSGDGPKTRRVYGQIKYFPKGTY